MKTAILLLFGWTVTSLSYVLATPTGAGSCAAGIAAIESDQPNNRHIQYSRFPGSNSTRPGNSGTLFEGATIVTLNGEPLVPRARNAVPSGTELVWEITANQVAFKGLLVRVEKESDDFALVGSDDTLQNSLLCDAFPGVIGVTHTSNEPKPVSSGTLSFSSGGTATLDITVVYDNTMSSIYAFDTFQLVIDEDESPTSAPFSINPAAVPTAFPSPMQPSSVSPVPVGTLFPTPPATFTLEPTKEKGMGMEGGMGMDKGMGMGMDKEGGMGMGGMGMDKEGGMGMGKESGMGMGGMGMGKDDDDFDDDFEPKGMMVKGGKEGMGKENDDDE